MFGCTVIDHKNQPLIANKHTNSYMYMYLQLTSVCFLTTSLDPLVCTYKMKTYFSRGKNLQRTYVYCFCLKHLVIDSKSYVSVGRVESLATCMCEACSGLPQLLLCKHQSLVLRKTQCNVHVVIEVKLKIDNGPPAVRPPN